MIALAAQIAMALTGTAHGAAQPAPDADKARWLRQLLPLPKEVQFRGQVTVAKTDVGFVLEPEPGELGQAAIGAVIGLFADKGSVHPRPGKAFTFRFQLRKDPDLAGLPNGEQAYRIAPEGEATLVLTATAEPGLSYACTTLRQLLRFEGDRVTVPLVSVRDWPDLAERGEWGGSANADIEWLAERKMNLVESHVTLSLDEAGHGVGEIDGKLLERGRKHGVKIVPIITHLDQIAQTGVYVRYPELKGVGKSAQGTYGPDQVAPCFSQPKMAELLSEWFASLASQPGVSDICVWLSEEQLQCGCETCRQKGQYVLEAEAAVRGWQLAREKHPKVRLRILLTQGSYSTNDKVLAVVPPEVGVTYYHGGLTYDSSRDPMIYPLLEQYAASGRWLGCYPQLTASWRIVCPWSGPQFVKSRMTEFVQKKLQCLCGYATPNNRLYDFNIQAAAEWSWNSAGRDEREFAASWASREGLKDPEKAADWAVTLGPVGWDVYGSGVPYPHFFGGAAKLIADRAAPRLGERMFRYFPTPEHFTEDLAACERALVLAREVGTPTLVAETEAIGGYVAMIQAVWRMASVLSGKQTLTEEEKMQAQRLMNELDAAALATVNGLQAWESAVGPGLGGGRFADTVNVTERTSADIGKALVALGIADPGAPFRPHKIGTWTDEDFQPGKERVTKTWEVTEALSGAGQYQVRFDYTQGWWGLTIFRVALASVPRDKPEALTEIAVDTHDGVAAYENKQNTYALSVTKRDPALRYFIVADIQGVTSEGKAENRRGCQGEAWVRKPRPEAR